MSLELLAKQRPQVARALYKLKGEVFKSGALTVREKELIAVALSCFIRCEICLQFHADRAKEAGASKDDLREAMDIALYLGGPSALIWSPIIDEIVSDEEAEE